MYANNFSNNMKRLSLILICALAWAGTMAQNEYVPTEENRKSRQEFSDMKFGIFIHWGIYSMYGNGEWFMNIAGVNAKE